MIIVMNNDKYKNIMNTIINFNNYFFFLFFNNNNKLSKN